MDFGPPPQREPRRAPGPVGLRAAIAVSIAFHVLLAILILVTRASLPMLTIEAARPIDVTIVAAPPPNATPTPRAAVTAAVATANATPAPSATKRPAASGTPAVAAATPAPNQTPSGGVSVPAPKPTETPRGGHGGTPGERGGVAFAPGIPGMIDDHFRRDLEKSGQNAREPGDPPNGRPKRPGALADDSIDGIPNLGTGEPGDPRIPGSGGVDIGRVLSRDARVAVSKEHTLEGVIHPFICDVKERMEARWNPSPADAAALENPERIPDPVCDSGAHLRYRVARVLAVYDAAGTRVSFTIVGATNNRNLSDRVHKIVDSAGMEKPPAELLDDEGLLRLAWNVYVDDYAGCHLIGNDGRGHKAKGGAFTIGIVELDGVY